jgi:hypothetical protein
MSATAGLTTQLHDEELKLLAKRLPALRPPEAEPGGSA